LHVGDLLQDLQADGALTGDHQGVVEGVDEDLALLLLDATRLGVGLVEGGAGEDHAGAEVAGPRDLDERGVLRHDDGRRDAEPPRMIGDALRVVAGRRGDGSPFPLLGRQALEDVGGAALLEGAGHLEVLELDENLRPGELAEGDGAAARRLRNQRADPLPRLEDVVRGDQANLGFCALLAPFRGACNRRAGAARRPPREARRRPQPRIRPPQPAPRPAHPPRGSSRPARAAAPGGRTPLPASPPRRPGRRPTRWPAPGGWRRPAPHPAGKRGRGRPGGRARSAGPRPGWRADAASRGPRGPPPSGGPPRSTPAPPASTAGPAAR